MLTRNAVCEATPAWSPDGRRSRSSGRAGRAGLADGRERRPPAPADAPEGRQFYGELDWAPTGRALVIKAFASTVGGANELWLVNARGRDLQADPGFHLARQIADEFEHH